jgi:hypothetical protein
MRKIIGVLVGMALVFVVGSADAANNGTGDPLGLIASAAIQPFYSVGPDDTLIEVDSPLDDNNGDNFLHVIYFNAACNRLISRPKNVSHKGVIVFSPDVDLAGLGPAGNTNGLAVIGRTDDFVTLTPIPPSASIHVRGYWFNTLQDFIRVVDTIAVDSSETIGAAKQTYSPLRSAASLVVPLDIPAIFTNTIHLICPTSTVYSETALNAPPFPTPPLSASLLTGFQYDDSENLVIDFSLACSCSSMFQLSTIFPTFGLLFGPSFLTYTELLTYNVVGLAAPPAIANNPPAFTGYRALSVAGQLDSFGRLANGSAYNYRNSGDESIDISNPNFTPGLR